MTLTAKEYQDILESVYYILRHVRKPVLADPKYKLTVSKKVYFVQVNIGLADKLYVDVYDYKKTDTIAVVRWRTNAKAYTIVDINFKYHEHDLPERLKKWFEKSGIFVEDNKDNE